MFKQGRMNCRGSHARNATDKQLKLWIELRRATQGDVKLTTMLHSEELVLNY